MKNNWPTGTHRKYFLGDAGRQARHQFEIATYVNSFYDTAFEAHKNMVVQQICAAFEGNIYLVREKRNANTASAINDSIGNDLRTLVK